MVATSITHAAEALARGQVILIPTETVYGLAVDATNSKGIAALYSLKKRDAAKPLQILVKDLEAAEKLADFPEHAHQAGQLFWPGPLTLVLPKRPEARISTNMLPPDQTIGIRVPDHPIMRALLTAYGAPIAATSANISGQKPAITLQEAREALHPHAPLTQLDGGKCQLKEASTVALVTQTGFNILREGHISGKSLNAV